MSVTSGKLIGANVEVVEVVEVDVVVELFAAATPVGSGDEAGLATDFAVVVGATVGLGEAVLLGATDVDVDAAVVGAAVVVVVVAAVVVGAAAVVVGAAVVVVVVAAVVVGAAVVVVDTVVSIVTDDAEPAELGPVFDEASRTELAERRAITVPSDEHATETVTAVPDAAEGVKTQPVAVPVFEKSPPAIPDTASLNVNV